MKKRFFLTVMFMAFVVSLTMGQDIKLPQPALSNTATLKEALQKRCSERRFDATKTLSNQELSNLLWAAWGFNRADKRTVPTARDRQEMILYVCMKSGVYQYDAKENVLKQVSKKNVMKHTGTQPFVEMAAVNLIYVMNENISTNTDYAAFTSGAMAQNVALYCATAEIGNVVRGLYDKEALHKEMGLPQNEKIVITQSVGYTK